MAEAPMTAGDEKTRIVQGRLSLYGPNPSIELVQQLMAEADEDIQKARAHELSLVTAHHNIDSTMTLIPAESTGRPKIPFAAFSY
ncbi:Hypothetical predicted protein [Pelobates cultripes]|uniref:Uncharacterized protein n=1 Tax=Pelobates cultripes TaxID=61616 RepID=A0AAD1WPR0_PELCU|nr:Hypothetical predicted protein [Pelobates cultripes]